MGVPSRLNPVLLAGIGASLAVIMPLVVTTDVGWQEILIVVGLLALAPFVASLVGGGGGPYVLRRWVPLPPAAIRGRAVRSYAADGWTPTSDHADALAFTRRPGANPGVALLLFLLGLVPGLLYLLIGGRTQTTTILTTAAPDATALEIIATPSGTSAQAAAIRFFNSLHELAGPVTPEPAGSRSVQPVP